MKRVNAKSGRCCMLCFALASRYIFPFSDPSLLFYYSHHFLFSLGSIEVANSWFQIRIRERQLIIWVKVYLF